MEKKGDVIIYKTEDGESQLEVKLEEETVWLNQKQMVELFKQTKQNISLHINNIFKEKELKRKSVVKESLTTGKDGKKYKIDYYNLDVIISVGYRVKSKRGTQFRIWATKTLREHIVQGYTINKARLEQQQKKLKELQNILEIIHSGIGKKQLSSNESEGLLKVITDYTRSFILLNQYDKGELEPTSISSDITYEISYNEATKAINKLKKDLIQKEEATELFGRQKDESLQGILKNIIQTFGGTYLYPSIEQQAAHLLYFTIKNHPFTDGNKRIGAFLFIWFLQRNKHLIRKNGEVKINDNALVALALLVAESNPDNKESIINLIINLINNQ